MKLIEPQAIRLLSSTVPENDAPAWDADTAYEIGDSVIHEHRVYKAVADSTGKQPDQHSEGTDAAWRLMGPTNRYAMLDQYVSTQTVAPMDAETLTFTVRFNRCTAFALLNFKATSIRAVVKDGDGLVMYDKTVNTLKDVEGYWEYYFRPLEMIVDQAVTDIPISPVATLEVTLTQKGGPALGHIVAGQAWFIELNKPSVKPREMNFTYSFVLLINPSHVFTMASLEYLKLSSRLLISSTRTPWVFHSFTNSLVIFRYGARMSWARLILPERRDSISVRIC